MHQNAKNALLADLKRITILLTQAPLSRGVPSPKKVGGSKPGRVFLILIENLGGRGGKEQILG